MPAYPQNPAATLNPPDLADLYSGQVKVAQDQVVYPMPLFPVAPNVGRQFRRFRANLTNGVANSESEQRIQPGIPFVIYALTGAARDTSGVAPTTDFGLNDFLVRFEHSSGDRLDTNEGLASALLGTAQRPALIGGRGWMFSGGSIVRVGITPLRANLRIDVFAWLIELRGPTNIGSLG